MVEQSLRLEPQGNSNYQRASISDSFCLRKIEKYLTKSSHIQTIWYGVYMIDQDKEIFYSIYKFDFKVDSLKLVVE